MSSSVHTSVLIIGGGPCGLGAAYRLNELASSGSACDDWIIIDSAATLGGLASSVVDDAGFTWDMGGHVIFSHYSYFTRLLDMLLPADEWNVKQREAWVWMRNRFIPYPFQQNIHCLPKADIVRCVTGLIDVERRRHTFTKPVHFAEWLQQSFGSGICDIFMTPYNKKVWAHNPEQMNVEWMGERVATVDTAKVVANIVNDTDEIGWGPNNTFRFPLHGGTGAIWKKLAERLPSNHVQLNKHVVAVDAAQHRVTFSDGSSITYAHLISTMPLDQLCRITTNTTTTTINNAANNANKLTSPIDLAAAADQFKHSSSHIVGFGISGIPPAHLRTKCWIYFPEDDCPFYRATIFSNYSQYNVAKPGEQWSIMCEISQSTYINHTIQKNNNHHNNNDNNHNSNNNSNSNNSNNDSDNSEEIIELALRGCYNTLLSSNNNNNNNNNYQILSKFHKRLEYGYPTPFVGRDILCQPLFNLFESHQIYSRGRFGSWKYEVSNQDHSLMLGVECVDRILFDTEEMTLKYPQIVNAKNDSKGRTPMEYEKKQRK